MVVIYAEKPGMARLFAAALGGIEMNGQVIPFGDLAKNEKNIEKQQRSAGFLKTTFKGTPYIVTWGYGHLCELKDIKDYDPAMTKWQNIPLPYIPDSYQYKVKESSRRQFDIVSRIFNSPDVEYIVNATDDDREGEAIFYNTYELSGSDKKIMRAILNKQTQAEIIKAISAPADQRVHIESAARARAAADWQIGISMTIKATLQYGEFGDTYNIGRVMTPTLNLIVEREKQIASFKSDVSYAVKAVFTAPDGTQFTGEYEEKFPTKEAAEAFVKKLDPTTAVVKAVENKSFHDSAPFPYSLDTLQKAANDTFGMTASDTLAAAQKVYEGYGAGGSLSYPRTDSSHYTEDMKTEIPKYIRSLSNIPEFAPLVKAAGDIKIPDKYFDNRKVDSHAALSITEILPPYNRLPEKEKNVYDLVARSVLMLAYPVFDYIRTKVTIDISGRDFIAKGRKILEPGWTVLRIKKNREKTKDDDKSLPELKKGDTLSVKFDVSQTKTQKPQRYTDSTLLTAMKNCGKTVEDADYAKVLSAIDGIGRPSTRAATIEKLVRTQYVTRQKNHLIPTQKAMILMDRLPVEDLKSPELTAHWETVLDKIAKGESDADDFINDVQDKSRLWCQQFYGDKIHLEKNESGMIEIASSAKKTPKFPDEAYGHKFTEKEKFNLSKGDTYYFSELVTKNGTKFSAWVQYIDHQLKYFKYNPFLSEAAVCPKCHSGMYESANGIACPKGCTVIPYEVSGKRLSIQDQYDLLTAGKTDVIRGFTSRKTGNLFDGRLMLNDDFRVVFKFSSEAKPPVFHVRPSLIGKKYHEIWGEKEI